MATATSVTLTLARGSPAGPKKMITTTASDVNAAFIVFPDTSTSATFDGNNDVYIVDFLSGSATGDTSLFAIFKGGTTDGTRLLKAAHGPTVVTRPIQIAPIRIPAGQNLAVQQLT